MRKALALLFFAVVACGQAQPVATTQATPGPDVCRLPVIYNLHGGFLTFPGGRLTMDPGGDGAAFYDRAFSRWLPVDAKAVVTGGARYAYTERKVPGTLGEQKLHVVDVSTGGDKVFTLSSPTDTSAYDVIELTTEGVWLTYSGYEGPRGGLFLVDLSTGAVKDVGGRLTMFDAIAGGPGVFWFTDPGPHPQQSGVGMGGILPARVNRLTVSDGSSEAWFTKDGSYLQILGTDLAGRPIFTDGNEVWLATAPDQAKVIQIPQGFYAVFADSHGIWLGGDKGLYLYTPDGETVQVSAQAIAPAGSCD